VSTESEQIANAYLIETEVPRESRQIVPMRRGPVEPIPLASPQEAHAVQRDLFGRFGLEGYMDCATVEMASRPIPHAFRVEKTAAFTELYLKWLPRILDRIIPEIQPPVQAYNKISRMGWPVLDVPDDKQPVLDHFFGEIESQGLSGFEESFTTIGIRLQPEEAEKEREFLFLDEGVIVNRNIGRNEKTVETNLLGKVVASRTRNVFNLPLPNLYKQVLDTAIHNAYLKYPLFHHDLYTRPYNGEGRPYFALDVKHFERFTASAARARGRMLGALYAEITDLFSRIPFLVPSANWKSFSFITPNREAGWSEQFASGDSGVTTVQKETFLALYSEYFVSTRHLGVNEALDLTLNGGDSKLTILNYGDDNFLFGEPDELKAVYRYLSEYLSVEEEVPPKFLGFKFDANAATERKFTLGVSSYLLKTYLPERSINTQFRKYPSYGWMMKRKIYEQYGEPVIAQNVFPSENAALEQLAKVKWSDIIAIAIAEMRLLERDNVYRDPRVLLDKAWMLDENEKIKSGIFFGYQPEKTGAMIKRLLDINWANKLRY